ncbi:MAG: nitrous oxide-stimulated promoter family protein [Coriobacteriia bacterium]|nr:nitrous oxide-stimulated promoter family protein [Coriobacteriia bacterium]
MTDRFAARLGDKQVRDDIRLVAAFAAIYCRGNHHGRERAPLVSEASALGVYGRKAPVMCEECAEHIRYAEKRRAYCPKDPKPFCAHCDTHCYKPDESEWQRQMMRYAGPRSVFHGYAIPGIKHALEARKWRKAMAARSSNTEGR